MLATANGADRAPSSPCEIVIELLRATSAQHPFDFVLQEQWYVRHLEGGAGRSASFPWSPQVLERLAAVQRERGEPAAAAWIAEEMRAFLDRLGWALDEERIRGALDAGRPVRITLRLGASELYALPWELVPLGATGRPLGSISGCLLQYEWPDTRSAPPAPDPPPEGGRILFAWSAAGGVVPADEHLAAIHGACYAGRHADFDPRRDVVSHASLGRLRAALRAAPVAVLHLLCHGTAVDASGTSYRLVLDADDGAGKELVDARALQIALADHLGSLRLVVLSACHGGNPGALDSRLGSVAQALHRAGIPAVVASRYPLAVDASVALTDALYRALLVDARSLAEAFLGARDRLRERASRAGWSSLQLYARAADGPDLRPIVHRPYRGLLAFQEEHARYFFGRDAEIAEAVGDLSALAFSPGPGRPRFLICTGASGTGKSSLVLAGVVPALRARDSRFVVAVMRPNDGWRASFEAALASRCDPAAPLLLVVDQFEELFTMISSHAERETFVRSLMALASNPSSWVTIVATLRVDFLARCGEIKLCSGDRLLEDMAYDEAHRVFVRRMKSGPLRRSIEQPAARAGLALEEGLAEQMLKDAGDEPGALPLLEYTLDQMWQRRRGRLLTWDQYNALGGVGGALERKADAILGTFDPLRRQAARRLLVQLVALDEGARLDRRRRVPLDALRRGSPAEAAVFGEVLDVLARERLLVVSGDDEGAGPGSRRTSLAAQAAGTAVHRAPVVEVAHEQLLRSWGTLRAWVREDRQMLAELQQLDRWVNEARGFPRYVLDGDRLGHARGMMKRYPADIGEAARRLIARSEAAEARRRRWTVGAAIAAAWAAVIMGVLAFWAQRQATRTRDLSISVGARELLAKNQPGPASRLLLEVSDPQAMPGWVEAANQIVTRPIPTITLFGHQREVMRAEFSPDGKRLVTASDDGTARIWNVDGSSDPIVLKSNTDALTSAAFSPDGERVVTGSADGTVRIWSADGRGEPVILQGPTGKGVFAVFTPDGKRVVTASRDGTVCVWSSAEPRRRIVLQGHEGALSKAALSPDGTRLVTGFFDGTVRVWNADGSGSPVVLRGHTNGVTSVAFSPDGKRIVTASLDGTARVWNADGSGAPVVLTNDDESISFAAFSPDGKWIVTFGTPGAVRLWIAGTTAGFVIAKDVDGIRYAAFSPDSKRIVLATSTTDTAYVWSFERFSRRVPLAAHQADVVFAAFSPDGKRIVTTSRDRTARVWDIEADPESVAFNPEGESLIPALDAGGKRFLTESKSDHVVKVRNMDGSGGPILLRGHTHHIHDAAFSPDGRRIVTASWDGTARVWNADGSGEPIVLRGHEGMVMSARFSPDGRRVVTVSLNMNVVDGKLSDGKLSDVKLSDVKLFEGKVRVFSADGHGAPIVFKQRWRAELSAQGLPSAQITFAAFMPDGQRILATSGDGNVFILRPDDLRDALVLDVHDGPINAAAFSPDGRRIVTASLDGTARIWNADGSGEPIVLRGHGDDVMSAVFSSDGRRVVTASWDGTARIWNADGSGDAVILRAPNREQLSFAQFSPDGQRVVAMTTDGTAQVWSTSNDALLRRLRALRTDCLAPDLRETYLVEAKADARARYGACERAQGRTPYLLK
ncbi:nSTAND1 domain-containing NTPase [Sorangium sp. So ce542]|uniref:nSTAND1 domain-containing NTPase n=1 Tax=Sorangium sp. So ce542 TaxID=3133316 RepID=UPI003F63E635